MKKALVILTILISACNTNNDYLLRVEDTLTGKSGYINNKSDTIIPIGKYIYCFTDTFKNYAIVAKTNIGTVGIDREEKVLYKVFIFDNGPDYFSEGYFRIKNDKNKIGYADTTGKIAIVPQFACAFPFKAGKAKVSNDCSTVSDGEHSSWTSNAWFYIDKRGKRVK